MLLTYLNQYRVEHAFRLEKDGMGMSTVYIQKPSRENAMMFVISLAAMLTDVADHLFSKRGWGMTFPNPVEKVKMPDLICDPIRRTEYLDGSDECIGLFMKAIDILGIDPDRLV